MARATAERVVRVHVLTGTVALLLGAFLAAVVAGHVFSAAHQAIGWFVASAVVAALLAPTVGRMQRVMRRGVAIGIVLVVIAAFVGVVGYGLFHDLSSQLHRLQRAVPEAAARLEQDRHLGQAARDFHLRDRAQEAVDGLGRRLTGQAQATARSVGAYFASTVLVIFLLTWGTRFLAGALSQVDDLERRARLRRVAFEALRRWRGYVVAALGQSVLLGCAAFVLCRAALLPASVPLALWVGLWAVVPYFGVLCGMVPILLLAAGLHDFGRAGWLLGAFVALQVAQVYLQQQVHRRTLYVGPGIVLVVGLVGYAVYAIGGTLVGVALAVLVLAVVDAAAMDEVPPEVLDPTLPDDVAPV